MIIGYDFFSKKLAGNIFDTAISTTQLDEVIIGAGIYDEILVSVDTTIDDKNERLNEWKLKTLMNPKFENDLEAGSIDSDGHVVTTIQIYRRKYLIEHEWLLVGQFDYDLDYNMYSFVDRFTENGVTYEYAIVPVARDVIGDVTVSPPIDVEYDGVFITDLHKNFRMEVDYEVSQVAHNNNMSTSTPLNGKHPIVTFGNQDYQTGNITFLPLTQEQVDAGGIQIDGKKERLYREQVLDFLKSGGAKVIRNDNGEMLIVATHGVTAASKNGALTDLSAVSFDFTEVGKFDFETMSKGGLIGKAGKSKFSFDEDGNIIWSMNFTEESEEARRLYRNSLPTMVSK